jgi:uncharacterized phage-associated protein
MATARDAAAYILEKKGMMTAMKLQKLVYYGQAWALVWDEAPLFEEPIEAWANGPVVRDLFEAHRGQFQVSQVLGGSSAALSTVQKETLDAVLKFYGDRSSQWLSDLTHSEDPWRNARVSEGLLDGERGSAVISFADMANYYSSLA